MMSLMKYWELYSGPYKKLPGYKNGHIGVWEDLKFFVLNCNSHYLFFNVSSSQRTSSSGQVDKRISLLKDGFLVRNKDNIYVRKKHNIEN